MDNKKCQKSCFDKREKKSYNYPFIFPLYVQVATPQMKCKNRSNKVMGISIYTYMEL